jgi:putative transposase
VNRLCQITGLSRAGYYRFRGRHNSRQGDMTLRNQIQHVALRWPAYGYRRVHAELVRQGWKINHKRVLRLSFTRAIASSSTKRAAWGTRVV